jgi:hypothetical protein
MSRKPPKGKSLAEVNPELAKQWHPTKNGDLTPFDFTSKSGVKVLWKCDKGDDHEWETEIGNRSVGKGCPICSGQKTVLSNCLETLRPDLTKEWHPTKNVDLTPRDIMPGSGKKVWWKCDKGDDHEWETSVVSRKKGGRCSICSGQKTVLSNCLATLSPNIANQWHPTKNGNLTAYDVTRRSNKKIWWKCDKSDDHQWKTTPNKRNQTKCPYCKTKFLSESNSFGFLYPSLSLEWHSTKNGDLTPSDVFPDSAKKVWWKCDKSDDHEWETSVVSRKKGGSCPICHSKKILLSKCLATTHPEIAEQWHPTKNGDLTPDDVVGGKDEKIWWKCPKGDDHEWDAIIYSRKSGSGCPVCAGRQLGMSNCLAKNKPKFAEQWHPTKNGKLKANEVTIGSNKKVWWQCLENPSHEWESKISGRVIDNLGCPFCSNQKTNISNSLATLYPHLVDEWHPTMNGKLIPDIVNPGSHRKVWWQCLVEPKHEWKTQINSRTRRGFGCPFCSNQELHPTNSLSALNPKLIKEWHPTKNVDLTPDDVMPGSVKKVWWKCNKGDDHEWKVAVRHRGQRGSNCPYCSLTPQSRQELTITFELIRFFKDINPKGFKTRVKGKLWSIDIYIPQLKLGIEFDGSYWHKDKRALDKLKTENLEEEGFEIFRVREEPLKRIFDDDIMSKQPFNAKQVTNDILTQIISRYTLDAKKITKIESYIAKKELLNKKGLDKYIEMILTEKAEKKAIK